jgi:4,5-DOPA dioxygenase extradiol
MTRMPALFLGHGSPMNAVEESAYRDGWRQAARAMPRPRAVLCVSAHWETRGVALGAAARPETIHDFYGFPKALFDVRYPAPGSPELARKAAALLPGAVLDDGYGLDHGAWGVLGTLYPEADVPVVQLSLDRGRSPAEHVELARRLAPLREDGVLVLGSGNIVHNLGLVDFRRKNGEAWADAADAAVRAAAERRDLAALADYPSLSPEMRRAVPTPEHYLPLLYILALRAPDEPLSFFNVATVMGSLSMTCARVG